MLVNGWEAVFGQSDKHLKEDEKRVSESHARTTERQNEAIREAREQRAMERQEAKNRLDAALRQENVMKQAYAQVSANIRASRNDLAVAKTNLERTKMDMKLLADKDAELVR